MAAAHMLSLLFFALTTFAANTTDKEAYSYAVVVDCGSSGSRPNIFRWKEYYLQTVGLSQIEQLPVNTSINGTTSNAKPGLAAFATNLAGIPAYLAKLIFTATTLIPTADQASTPIFMKATAGMRLLTATQADAVWAAVRDYLSNTTNNPFEFMDNYAKTLSGEEEAVFGWLTSNTISNTSQGTTGALDLGGASTQIVFNPNTEILANAYHVNLKVTPNITLTSFSYAYSFLKFGQDQARQRTILKLQAQQGGGMTITHPCFPSDYQFNETIGTSTILVMGNGSTATASAECMAVTLTLLDLSTECFASPCSINGVYMPDVMYARGPFLATSAYFYEIDGFGLADNVTKDWKGPLTTLSGLVDDLCSRNMSDANTMWPRFGTAFVGQACFNGHWILRLLVDAYKFNTSSTTQLKIALAIGNYATGWPLGGLIYELGLGSFGRLTFVDNTNTTGNGTTPKDCTSDGISMSFNLFTLVLPLIAMIINSFWQ